ncbi:MAG: hypothetical protein ACHQNE_03060, partial [Candidatus Kapaibacterium sp.]
FLDGSLPADDEAELLHTLSVSPEKRGMLRGFMEQRSLFTRDAKSLSVPYDAEQRLWARIDRLTPAESPAEPPVLVPVETSIAGDAPNAGFFAHALRGASALASAVTLFAGIGIGYFAGAHHSTTPTPLAATASPARSVLSAPSNAGTIFHRNPGTIFYRSHGIARGNAPAPVLAALPPVPSIVDDAAQPSVAQNPAYVPDASNGSQLPAAVSSDAAPQEPMITRVPARISPAIAMNDIGGDGGGIKPMFHQIRPQRTASTLFLNRFEFRIDESFGRQFPNNAATNVSLPLITNTSVSAFFQVLPHSNLLWAGAGYGTANITRKNLYTQTGDPFDPSQQVLAADTSHAQTSYIAAIAELRLPAFETTDLTFDAGYGYASLGQMMFGEIGLHYNISEEVGTQFGLRVLRFSYDLSGEKSAAIQSGSGGLAISNAVASAGPSFNTELNAGLFFHF